MGLTDWGSHVLTPPHHQELTSLLLSIIAFLMQWELPRAKMELAQSHHVGMGLSCGCWR